MIEANNINEAELSEIESIDNCFPDIDYRVYLPIDEGLLPQQEKRLVPLYGEKRMNEFRALGAIK